MSLSHERSSSLTPLGNRQDHPDSSAIKFPTPRSHNGLGAWLTWLDIQTWERDVLILSTLFKILLFPSYRSTDFEVHRNWLAITYSLPLSKWYFDTTSEWTLDYPPFFAYFEFLLSLPARLIDPTIVDLNNLNYCAWSVIAYQRSTVILTELVLGAAVLRFARKSINPTTQRIISVSLFLHPGFLIVDHVHFQYNGFMFGILLWSILMAREGRTLASGVLFAVLLNFKHIYMYLAPAYFVYLLRAHCISSAPPPNSSSPRLPILGITLSQFNIIPFLSLANAVTSVFVLSLGPFMLLGIKDQLPQIASRLFPFKRGLNHAYWAPNVWAGVTALDRVLLRLAKKSNIDLNVNISGVTSTSRGLVGDTVFAVLPNIKPSHTFLITIAFQAIFLAKLWKTPTYTSFLTALTLCGYASFLFGWHVHEKAVLLVLVPLSLLAAESGAHFRTYVLASVAGIYSLFPLLFTPSESFLKVVYSVVWCVAVFGLLSKRVYEFPDSILGAILDRIEKVYLAGFAILHVFVTFYTPSSSTTTPTHIDNATCTYDPLGECSPPVLVDSGGMEFLPLMLTSVYCAIGLIWAFLRLGWIYVDIGRKKGVKTR